MRKFLFAVACWATVGLAMSRADVSYQYVSDQASYTGAVGSVVTVQLLLQETVTGSSTGLIFADGGLFGAGVLVTAQPGGNGAIFGSSTTTNDFKIAGNTQLAPNGFASGSPPATTALSQVPFSSTQSGLIINGDVPGSNSFQFPSGGAGVRTALLGTLNFTVGSQATTYKLTNYGGASNTITQAGTDLDFGTQAANGYTGTTNNPLGFFTFTVGTPVPEPTSMALCGLLVSGMSYVGIRRRKANASEPAPVA